MEKKAQLTAVYLTIIRMKISLAPFLPEGKQFALYLSPVVAAFLPARKFITGARVSIKAGATLDVQKEDLVQTRGRVWWHRTSWSSIK